MQRGGPLFDALRRSQWSLLLLLFSSRSSCCHERRTVRPMYEAFWPIFSIMRLDTRRKLQDGERAGREQAGGQQSDALRSTAHGRCSCKRFWCI